jgi:hypothetical protein
MAAVAVSSAHSAAMLGSGSEDLPEPIGAVIVIRRNGSDGGSFTLNRRRAIIGR